MLHLNGLKSGFMAAISPLDYPSVPLASHLVVHPIRSPMYRVFIILSVAWLAACSQLPEHKRPPLPVPDLWKDKEADLSKADAAKTHWKNYFTDPRLQALITAALENNRDMRMAVARVQEARAQFVMAKADQFPVVSIGPAAGTAMLSGSVWPYTSVSYELDFWGRIESLTESARFSLLATEEAQRAVHLTLVADIASAYFEILQAQELLATMGATVALRESSLELLKKSVELGATYGYEIEQANGVLESTRASEAALEHQRAVAVNRLNFLVGRVEMDLPKGKSLQEQGLDSDFALGLPSGVLLLRPDVMAAENRLKAANANIGAARAALFPKIGLSAGFGSLSAGLMSVFEASRAAINPVLALPAIFDGGRQDANVDAVEARQRIAIAEYEKTIQLAFREVSDQLSARSSLIKQMRATLANAAAQEKRMHMTQIRHELGAIGYLEVIDAQREQLASQQASIGVRRAQLEAAVQLYKVLGGGEQSVN